MPIPCSFVDQYDRAKETFTNALNNNFTIILWGEGANGKSHLIDEFRKELRKKNYTHVFYQPNIFNNMNQHNKLIIEANNINCINEICVNYNTEGLVFINMNTFQYPKYTRLRSGKL